MVPAQVRWYYNAGIHSTCMNMYMLIQFHAWVGLHLIKEEISSPVKVRTKLWRLKFCQYSIFSPHNFHISTCIKQVCKRIHKCVVSISREFNIMLWSIHVQVHTFNFLCKCSGGKPMCTNILLTMYMYTASYFPLFIRGIPEIRDSKV